jgi:YgiT-type zinc finger domain-containing protein
LEIGTTVSTLNLGFGLLVVKNVPARICAQCGEEWIDDQTAGCIEKLAEETKQRRSEIEVLAF